MAISQEEIDQACDLFSGLGAITARKMFGGAGLYHAGLMFALIANGEIYLKVDDANRAEFEAAGSTPFTYDAKGKPMTMSYWRLPDAALDDPDEAQSWGRLGLDAALRAASKKKPKTNKSNRKSA